VLKSKNNSITEGEMFAALSKHSNYLPEGTVKDVYYGLLKVITEQFRAGKDIILPGLGKLYVIQKREQQHYNINLRKIDKILPPSRQVVFIMSDPFKKYINQMIIKD